MLGHCLMRDGRTMEAVREWEWLVRDLPRHRGGWMALQGAYQAMGRTREAGVAAEKAKKLAPKG
jgi:Flp pilus assembly protein TadD